MFDTVGGEVRRPRLRVVDLKREVRHASFGRTELHEVNLLRPSIKPRTGDPEIGPVYTLLASERRGVKRNCRVDIVDT